MKRIFQGVLLWLLTIELVLAANLPFKVETLINDLRYPWGMAFITTTELLVTEKGGAVKYIQLNKQSSKTIATLPVAQVGQGGLLDIVLHPKFKQNRWVYLTYSKAVTGGYTTVLARGTFNEGRLEQIKELLLTSAASRTSRHFGSRIVFDQQGYLYMTIGDRGDRRNSQRLDTHAGKVLRLTAEGKPATDNPFIKTVNALPEIYSYGHRNPQGMVFDNTAQQLWLHEHGPKGGDEINLVKAGVNYGWPVITYGREYSGDVITEKTHDPNMEQPHWYWVPSIAPSGMALYRGNQFKNWQGDFLVGALKDRLLARVTLTGVQKGKEQRYDFYKRIRAVTEGPDGFVYLLTDQSPGELLRLLPE
ncbi:PQQ-dependent sugar dehydrogenase [Spartinivicinus poritis]|uniref:PQQ-dependent sugar dehydrogenase n=1 Tax=Spartinivicinus poritis TaxID=2994640 RepID=A0ABT5UH71_9GAMM|nr:PQQ-dependent sugar dehydrogenase [Spartinivicinus sp. A2-2]MDE1465662.1 PQQ-dependent sugar dehydrogenase [Spartinivicinus sp. A2-2]